MDGKKVKIAVKDNENLEFKLLEDAKAGDFIALKEINNIDFSPLEKEINEQKNQLVMRRVAEEKKNWINEFKSSGEYLELSKKYNEEISNNKILQERITNLQKEQKQQEENVINRYKQSNEYKELEFKIHNLKNELENFKKQSELEKQNEILKKQEELNNQYLNLKEKFEEEKKSLNLEIDSLRRIKGYHSQSIGNDLEQWIQSRFNESLRNLEDCTLDKTTQAIEGTKPDFLFKILNSKKETIASVTIEAKSKDPDKNQKKKNKSFYEDLDKNREKQKSDIAILVTEVESEDEFLIMKVPDPKYTNMYQCRPSGLIPLLSLIRLIYKKREDLLSSKGVINFEKKQEIINKFNALKSSILDITLSNINKKVLDIQDRASKMKKLSEDIYEDARVVIETHLNSIKNKIQDLSLKVENKFIKEIEKLNE